MAARLAPDDSTPLPLTSALPGWTARPAAQTVPEARVIGVLAGEGIGPEVTGAALRVLDAIESATELRFDIRRGGKIGLEARRDNGATLTREVTEFCGGIFAADGAVFSGPGGGRFVYELRSRFDLYCKLVPLQPLPALHGTGPLRAQATQDVDVLVVRENTGGIYQGEHGEERRDGMRVAHQRFEYTEAQVVRILRVAAALAQSRRGRLCVVTKPAGVPTISELWNAIARDVAGAADVELRLLEVDTACYQLVADAHSFDVVAAPNLFGDVLADAASVLLGARGMSWSGNFGAAGLAVYQTGHGAAWDIAGSDQANPLGQIQSLAMMLRESFGLAAIADAVLAACNETLRSGWRTPDIMAPRCRCVGTQELAARVAESLADRLAGQRVGTPAPATVLVRAATAD